MDTCDQVLIEEAKQNPERFDALYQKYFQTIYNYFWYRVGHDQAVADDLTQDTFVRAFQALARYQDRGRPYISYLLTIAHNVLVNHYRTERDIPSDTLDIIPAAIVPDIEERDLLERLWWAIQDLHPVERDIIYLHYNRGYKLREIATITGKSENAVKLQLSRARKRLLKDPRITLSVAERFQEANRKPRIPRYKQR